MVCLSMICLSAEERVGKRERSGPCKLRAPPTPAVRDFMWNTFYLIFQYFFESFFHILTVLVIALPPTIVFEFPARRKKSVFFPVFHRLQICGATVPLLQISSFYLRGIHADCMAHCAKRYFDRTCSMLCIVLLGTWWPCRPSYTQYFL